MGWSKNSASPFFFSYYWLYLRDIICWHGYFEKLVIDRGLKNKDVVVELAQKYAVKIVVVLAYYLQVSGMIECKHKPIIDTISKMSDGRSTN